MALTPLNRQEEWYQEMINAQTGNYLPSITAQDEGKVLTVENDGSWGVENVPNELPTVGSSDKDKYLHTNGSTGAVEWADAPKELPSVSGTDEGKVLTVNNSGVWGAQEPIGKKFIVTLTPTALDYSGTMDKTVAEINAAYEAGQQIVFRVVTGAPTYMEVDCNARWYNGNTYPSFNGFILDDDHDLLIEAFTSATNDGTKQTYGTAIYPLDNASGVLVVTDTNGMLDKTWQEIVDAMSTTGAVLAHYDDGSIDILKTFLKADVDPKSGEYTVSTGSGITGTYVTTSASGYPVQQSE